MGQPSNTFSSYDAAGNREDLADLINMVAQADTPFLSSIAGEQTVDARYTEWQTDTLDTVDTANYLTEGDDVTMDAVVATTRVGNRLQISDKSLTITGTQEVVAKAGRTSEVAYNMDKKLRSLKRDMDYSLLANQASVTGDDSTPRRLGGLASWLTSNVDRGSGGSSGGFSGGNTAAATNGTQRALTESMLKSVIRSAIDNGGEPTIILANSFNRQVISGFAGNATATRDVSSKKITATAGIYVSDFGTHKIVFEPRIATREVMVIDPDMVSVGYLKGRKLLKFDLAKTGDTIKKQFLSEFTLICKNQAAHGIVADLTTS